MFNFPRLNATTAGTETPFQVSFDTKSNTMPAQITADPRTVSRERAFHNGYEYLM